MRYKVHHQTLKSTPPSESAVHSEQYQTKAHLGGEKGGWRKCVLDLMTVYEVCSFQTATQTLLELFLCFIFLFNCEGREVGIPLQRLSRTEWAQVRFQKIWTRATTGARGRGIYLKKKKRSLQRKKSESTRVCVWDNSFLICKVSEIPENALP